MAMQYYGQEAKAVSPLIPAFSFSLPVMAAAPDALVSVSLAMRSTATVSLALPPLETEVS